MWPFKKERKYPREYTLEEITNINVSLIQRYGYIRVKECYILRDGINNALTKVRGNILPDGTVILNRDFSDDDGKDYDRAIIAEGESEALKILEKRKIVETTRKNQE